MIKTGLWLTYLKTEEEGTRSCVFFYYKKIIFAIDIKSRSFYSSFDIARRYAKHRGLDYLYTTENGEIEYILKYH